MTQGWWREKVPKIFSLALFICIVAGWFMSVVALIELRAMKNARGWTAHRGVITQSYARRVRGYQNRRFWRAEIAGVYADTGQKFNASRIGYGLELSVCSRRGAERAAARYPVGMELDVYPDPQHPSSAVLVRGNSPAFTLRVFWVSLGFALLPFLLYAWGRRRKPMKENISMTTREGSQ